MAQESEEDQPVIAEEFLVVPVLYEGSKSDKSNARYQLHPEECLYAVRSAIAY